MHDSTPNVRNNSPWATTAEQEGSLEDSVQKEKLLTTCTAHGLLPRAGMVLQPQSVLQGRWGAREQACRTEFVL